MPSIVNRLPDPLRTRRRFADRERDRPFETPRPRDEQTDAPGRVRGDPGVVRLSEALAGGFHGRLDATRRAAEIPLRSRTVRGRAYGHLPIAPAAR